MISLELPEALEQNRQNMHGLARDLFRTIARKYDIAEHVYPEELEIIDAIPSTLILLNCTELTLALFLVSNKSPPKSIDLSKVPDAYILPVGDSNILYPNSFPFPLGFFIQISLPFSLNFAINASILFLSDLRKLLSKFNSLSK